MLISHQKVNENSTSAFNYWDDFSWAECIRFMTSRVSNSKFGKQMRFVDVYIQSWKLQEVQQSCKMFTIYSLYVHCMFYVNVIKLHWQSFASLLASRLSEKWSYVSRIWLFCLHSRNRPILAILLSRSSQVSNEISAHQAGSASI